MGLLNLGIVGMTKEAFKSTLADQTKEYFECSGMTQDILCMPATKIFRGKAINNATSNVISNGSIFDVAVNQAAILIENGRIHDFVIGVSNAKTGTDTTGQYKYESDKEPSFFDGGFASVKGIAKTMFNRIGTGGQASNTMRLIYINLRPIMGNKIGFGGIPFRDGEWNLSLKANGNGNYIIQIENPLAFYENVVNDPSKPLNRINPDVVRLFDQMKSEMKQNLQIALTRISKEKKIPYDEIGSYPKDLARIMNEEMSDTITNAGLAITDLALQEINVDDASAALISKYQQANLTGSNQAVAYGMGVQASTEAVVKAAGNSAGVGVGFMGMNMAGNMGGNVLGSIPQPPQPQQPAAQPASVPATNTWACSCGTQNTGKFCNNCGSAQPAPAPAAGSWNCSCGTTSNTGKFCNNCGSPKPAAVEGWTCKCGAISKGRFCTECGSPKPATEPLYKCDKCGWEPADPKNPPKFCPECGDIFDDSDIK